MKWMTQIPVREERRRLVLNIHQVLWEGKHKNRDGEREHKEVWEERMRQKDIKKNSKEVEDTSDPIKTKAYRKWEDGTKEEAKKSKED